MLAQRNNRSVFRLNGIQVVVDGPPLVDIEAQRVLALADELAFQRLREDRTNLTREGLQEWARPFLETAYLVTVWWKGQLLGTVRVVFPAFVCGGFKVPMELEEVHCPVESREGVAEIARLASAKLLAVDGERPLPALLPLMGDIWAVAAQRADLSRLVFFTTRGIWAHLLRGGFPLIADHEHQKYVVRDITGYLDTRETVGALKLVNRGRFTTFWHGLVMYQLPRWTAGRSIGR